MGSKNIRGQIESSSASFVLKDGASTQLTLTHPASNTAARVLTLPANDADYNLPAVIHGGDTTKAVQFTTSSGTTATTLNMIASISSNRSFTFADGDSVVGGDSNSNDIITKAGSQTLLNKTLTSPTITGATFSIPDSDASHELTLTWNENEASSARVLNILVNGANRTVDLTGNLTLAANLTTTTGAITLAGDAGGSSLTLPASGTVAVTGDKLSVFAATSSSELAGVISDNTGSGALVFGTSPNLTTPVLGVATATTINKVTLTAPATGSTLTIADGKTLTASNTLTFTGTDSSSVAFGTGGTVTYTSNKLSVFSATTSAELAGVISDETGSSGGVLVFNNSPALTTPTITSPVITTDLTMNDAAELKYKGTADENYLGFKAPATVTASTTWTLPDGDGSNGQRLITNGAGVLSWDNASSANTDINDVGNASYTILDDDGYGTIIVGSTTLTANRTVTLPTASANTDRIIKIKNIDNSATYTVTVLGEAVGETIDGVSGSTGIAISSENDSVTLICDGSKWYTQDYRLATATQAGALEKNFRWQTKTASNQTSTNTSMITFNNITSGKTYRLDFKGDASSTDTTSTMRVLFYIPSGVESTESPTIGVDASSSYTWGTDVYVRISDSKLVKANASSIVIGALVDGTNSLLSNIAVTITELPNHEETTDFT